MDWCYLGHASWLADVGGTRILFDPQLGDTHHDGIFRVHPHRTLNAEALRPDIIVVTHRHPDHFDVNTLDRLAQLDPTALVLTADPFIAKVAKALGFEHTGVLDPRTPVPLGDERFLYTTPSFTHVVEWGVIVTSPEGTVWNQVDTVLRDPQTVVAERRRAAELLGDPRLLHGVDLGLVRWNVMQQINAHTGEGGGFPYSFYQRELARVVATGARTVVPGAAGECYVGDAAWLNRWVFPVDEPRFLADLSSLAPQIRGTRGVVGGHWRLEGGAVHVDATPDAELLTVHATEDPRCYDPRQLAVLADPRPTTSTERDRVRSWIAHTLAPALPSTGLPSSTRCRLEVVWHDDTEIGSFHADGTSVPHSSDWDLLNRIAGSDLLDVIDGTAHWGRPLLSGRLRIAHRLYSTDGELKRLRKNSAFLYAPLSYDASTERWTAWLVSQCLARRT